MELICTGCFTNPVAAHRSAEHDSAEMLVCNLGAVAFPNFTVEMETGTGKTYVYLRTIHELAKTYGSPQGISAHDALRCNYCGNTVHLDHHHMAWYDT